MVAVELPEGAGQGKGGAMSQYNGASSAAGSSGAPAIILNGVKLSGSTIAGPEHPDQRNRAEPDALPNRAREITGRAARVSISSTLRSAGPKHPPFLEPPGGALVRSSRSAY
jgi:hypothetical protein